MPPIVVSFGLQGQPQRAVLHPEDHGLGVLRGEREGDHQAHRRRARGGHRLGPALGGRVDRGRRPLHLAHEHRVQDGRGLTRAVGQLLGQVDAHGVAGRQAGADHPLRLQQHADLLQALGHLDGARRCRSSGRTKRLAISCSPTSRSTVATRPDRSARSVTRPSSAALGRDGLGGHELGQLVPGGARRIGWSTTSTCTGRAPARARASRTARSPADQAAGGEEDERRERGEKSTSHRVVALIGSVGGSRSPGCGASGL